MADVFLIANYIINYPDIYVDNLKLQKLLFYCQAVSLFINDKPLFEDEIQAWDYGPVIPRVYSKYKNFDGEIIEESNYYLFSEEDQRAIDFALQNYGSKTGSELINLTHSEKPWREAYSKGRNTVITTQSIKDFYSTIYHYE